MDDALSNLPCEDDISKLWASISTNISNFSSFTTKTELCGPICCKFSTVECFNKVAEKTGMQSIRFFTLKGY